MREKNILWVLIAGALLATSGTVFAERQAKTVICHVGSECGPGDTTYLDEPGCVPYEGNDYFCPDAGKVDLLEVANANNHLNNPNHTFEYAPGEFVSDYEPDPAWGGSKEDTDSDGIDQGCQEPQVDCPCWDEAELLQVTQENQFGYSCSGAEDPGLGDVYPDMAFLYHADQDPIFWAWDSNWSRNPGYAGCMNPDDYARLVITEEEAAACIEQIADRCEAIGSPIRPD